ncbi:hypothetical protein AC1031_002665 [Aphanomyces cochlioides]|nr:hypothetical protein AC1031_002665 [Aphanomyces cochlioides]
MIAPSAFRMAEFIADTPQFIVDPASTRVIIVDTPALPTDGNVKTSWMPNMDYWNDPVVSEASIIIRYHKFMNLVKVKKQSIELVPTSDIDLVNIGRIIDHDDTIEGGDLRKGYGDTFLLWSMAYNDVYSSFAASYVSWTSEKTNNMVNHHFLKQKWKNFGRLPSRDCRFFGVDEAFADEALPYAAAVVPDAKAVECLKESLPEALSVYMTVIGTPVMDGRWRPERRH